MLKKKRNPKLKAVHPAIQSFHIDECRSTVRKGDVKHVKVDLLTILMHHESHLPGDSQKNAFMPASRDLEEGHWHLRCLG